MHHNKKKRRRKVQFESKKMSIAIEHVFGPLMRTMFCTADREAISVLQRAGIFVERWRYTVMQEGHLCSVFLFIKETYVSLSICMILKVK